MLSVALPTCQPYQTTQASRIHGHQHLRPLSVRRAQVHAGVAKSASLAEKGMSTTTDKAFRSAAHLVSWREVTSPIACDCS